eukprot:6187721-Pleurochrysis_carterae.AAC.2
MSAQCMHSAFTVSLLLRKCAARVFGDSVLHGKEPSTMKLSFSQVWFELIFQCCVLNADGIVQRIDYHVEGRRVCGGAFAAVYSIPPATFTNMSCHVLRGDHAWATYAQTRTRSAARDKSTLVASAEVWWYQPLKCYNIMPHLTGVIVHPVRKRL